MMGGWGVDGGGWVKSDGRAGGQTFLRMTTGGRELALGLFV